jgi:Ca2+-binding EF-hand superfamily protein
VQEILFDDLDQDNNAILSTLEVLDSLYKFGEKVDPRWLQESMLIADQDLNGLVSQGEFLGYLGTRFDAYDSNADGYLSIDEARRNVEREYFLRISGKLVGQVGEPIALGETDDEILQRAQTNADLVKPS